MNNPLKMIENKLPEDVTNNIRSYMRNDFIYKALNEYFDYIFYKKELYEDFMFKQYIEPNCQCQELGFHSRLCSGCWMYDETTGWFPDDYKICIYENPQYKKIRNYNSKKISL